MMKSRVLGDVKDIESDWNCWIWTRDGDGKVNSILRLLG